MFESSSGQKGRVRKWQVEMEWEVFNKSQTIRSYRHIFFWFIKGSLDEKLPSYGVLKWERIVE